MAPFANILVPTDLSGPSERAVDIAIELSTSFGARLTLLHVWSIPNAGYAEALAWPTDAMERAAADALEKLRMRVAEQYPQTEALLRLGLEWQQIIDVVKERAIDLVVMATHGRRGLPRLLLGSVTEKVVRLSPVPVLTVGPRTSERSSP